MLEFFCIYMYFLIMIELQSNPSYRFNNLVPFPLYMGQEQCKPNHKYGRVRSHWLVHYVASGMGQLQTGNQEYILGPGQAFLLPPSQEHWYKADSADPWTYWWIGFNGPQASNVANWFGINRIPQVIFPSDSFETSFKILWDCLSLEKNRFPPGHLTARLLDILEQLFARELFSIDESSCGQWNKIMGFFEAHYCELLSLEDLYRSCSVSSSELHRLFYKHLGMAPKKYLTQRRMERAKSLLLDARRPISRVSSLVGYKEYQSFERQFKRWFGISPREWRIKEGVG